MQEKKKKEDPQKKKKKNHKKEKEKPQKSKNKILLIYEHEENFLVFCFRTILHAENEFSLRKINEKYTRRSLNLFKT